MAVSKEICHVSLHENKQNGRKSCDHRPPFHEIRCGYFILKAVLIPFYFGHISIRLLFWQVQRPQNSTLWTLQIKYPQLRDAGIYECEYFLKWMKWNTLFSCVNLIIVLVGQINSEPKISLSYQLNVIGECFFFFHILCFTWYIISWWFSFTLVQRSNLIYFSALKAT